MIIDKPTPSPTLYRVHERRNLVPQFFQLPRGEIFQWCYSAVKCLSPVVAYCGLESNSSSAEVTVFTLFYRRSNHTFFKVPKIKVVPDVG